MIFSLFIAVLGFANLTPQGAIDAAVSHSPDVAAAQARAFQSASLLAVARGTLVPALATTYQQVPQGNPPGPTIISRLVTVGLQTTLNDFLGYGPAVRQAVLTFEASRADAAVAERAERSKAYGLYFDALKARAIAAARERGLTSALAQLEAARKRNAAGDAPKLDVLRANVAVARATADAETARVGDVNATEALAVETSVPASDLQTTIDAPPSSLERAQGAPLGDARRGDPAALVVRALAARAEIASANATLNAARASRSIARNAGLPGISVTGGYTAGTDSGVPIGGPSLNVALSVPLGGVARARAAVEEGRVAEARARAESARRAVTLEVSAAARTLGALERAAVASTRAREGAEAEVAATELGYRSGASSSFEVSAARATYAQALIDELSALYDVAKAQSTLVLQVGR